MKRPINICSGQFGDMPLEELCRSMKEIGYDGFLTIERETGADPSADIKKAAEYARAHFYL